MRAMGTPEADWALPSMKGFTRETGIALLNRAAEIGLLTAYGGGYYSIHPALPWFFNGLFDAHYASSRDPCSATSISQMSAVLAFVEAMGALGDYYHDQYQAGNREVIAALNAEEANLKSAWALARSHGWWRLVISSMQGLRSLYRHTGRRAEWAALVEETVPDFVNPETDEPLPEREYGFRPISEYRVRLAREIRHWPDAERLQRILVTWDRNRAAPALAVQPEKLDSEGRHAIRTLTASLHELGQIRRELVNQDCIKSYEESLSLAQLLGDRVAEAACAYNIGWACTNVPLLRDLDRAERSYRRSLELHKSSDHLGRGNCLGQIGSICYERFKEAQAAQKEDVELLGYLSSALGFYNQALKMLPPDAIDGLGVTHNQLGLVYASVGDLEQALSHYRDAIRYREMTGDHYRAGQTRLNVARTLANSGRLDDAREYAEAAIRSFQYFGDRAAAEVEQTLKLIAQIEKDLHSRRQ
jgi:tetratricopeptide (TPR) repeat protein